MKSAIPDLRFAAFSFLATPASLSPASPHYRAAG